MLILLPPSEGKHLPVRGKPLDLGSLSSAELTPARTAMLTALVELCADEETRAAQVLGLGATQAALVAANASLTTAATARADRVYTGVLYDALGFADLSPAGKRRSNARVAITSSLFGLVRPADRIPGYRLSGDVRLPGVGPVAGFWREHLGPAVRSAVGSGLLVDLRSSAYAAFWRPPAEMAARVATVRVLHEQDGVRKVVSHFNKATKGRLVRAVLESGASARSPQAFADLLGDLGWQVEVGESDRAGTRLDVVVTAI